MVQEVWEQRERNVQGWGRNGAESVQEENSLNSWHKGDTCHEKKVRRKWIFHRCFRQMMLWDCPGADPHLPLAPQGLCEGSPAPRSSPKHPRAIPVLQQPG